MPTLSGSDLRILRELVANPRIGITELAQRVGIARNTAQARVARLERQKVVGDRGREVDLDALGLGVTAFVTMQIAQGRWREAINDVTAVPYVLEAHSLAGEGDLMVRVAARDTPDLHRVINSLLDCRGVLRSSTAVAMSEQIGFRTGPVIDELCKAPRE